MSNLAIIRNGIVENVIVGNLADFPGAIELTGSLRASPGDAWNGAAFTPAVATTPKTGWTELGFWSALTPTERNALRVAAAVKDEAVLSDAIAMLAVYGKAGKEIPANDVQMVAWVDTMLAKGIVTADKAKAIKDGKI